MTYDVSLKAIPDLRFVSFRQFRFDCLKKELVCNSNYSVPVPLQALQIRLLMAFLANADLPLTKTWLEENVWRDESTADIHVSDDAISQAVMKLRRILGDDAAVPKYIETKHKIGYVFRRRPQKTASLGRGKIYF